MAKRKDSFSRALADAMKRLEQAERQRQSTREILARLELEIPALQRTIVALDRQLNPVAMWDSSKIPSPPAEQPEGQVGYVQTEEDLLPEPEGTPVVPEE